MEVTLSPELHGLVQEKVSSGRFGSASDVVAAALQLMRETDAHSGASLAALRCEVLRGLADLDAGRSVSFDSGESVADAIIAQGKDSRVTRSRTHNA